MALSTPPLTKLRKANIPWFKLATGFIGLLTSHWYGFDGIQIRIYGLAYISIFLIYYAEEFLAAFQDSQEPPLIPSHGIPFLGHVIVNRKTNHPIYTLQTLTARTIIVISPQLAAPIQRASKSMSFYGMILEVTKRLVDFDEPSMEIIRYNLDGEHGSTEGLMNESHNMVASVLSPGPVLNSMSTMQLEKFSELLNPMIPGSESLSISLMDFVKRTFTTANAFAIYGPQNPFAMHPELLSKFWEYEAGMIAVMANIFPWITARKPWLARKAINAALQEFVEKEYYKTASPMIQKRVAINLKHGLTTKMAGHAELILLFGIIGNAVPTTFWFLANVFSRPELLAQIRKETATAVTTSSDGKERVINVTKLKTTCPLLVSTYRETLRKIANLSSVRLVTRTHAITTPNHRPYLLKKSSIVQIASGVIHSAPSVWGSDATEFVPTRFISTTTTSEQFSSSTASAERTATALPKNVPSAAYRAFGGGSVICPGRHFAQSEILGFVALCVWMFDVEDEKGGVMKCPERDDGRIPLSVMKPVKEPQIRIRRRKGEEDVAWRLEL
ncbi:cytochrome P450 [Zopfia rhizophila CBS 207.26]|uniref:Cytochrome P450 n=1 Tax=Zopfia rhizophila CBS 207.26 TaxID=1314779 RepID=A0A6A6ETD8_9PEZI|nr:cytochrome P450 [Zopfia rhizophila CBS 207.26]